MKIFVRDLLPIYAYRETFLYDPGGRDESEYQFYESEAALDYVLEKVLKNSELDEDDIISQADVIGLDATVAFSGYFGRVYSGYQHDLHMIINCLLTSSTPATVQIMQKHLSAAPKGYPRSINKSYTSHGVRVETWADYEKNYIRPLAECLRRASEDPEWDILYYEPTQEEELAIMMAAGREYLAEVRRLEEENEAVASAEIARQERFDAEYKIIEEARKASELEKFHREGPVKFRNNFLQGQRPNGWKVGEYTGYKPGLWEIKKGYVQDHFNWKGKLTGYTLTEAGVRFLYDIQEGEELPTHHQKVVRPEPIFSPRAVYITFCEKAQDEYGFLEINLEKTDAYGVWVNIPEGFRISPRNQDSTGCLVAKGLKNRDNYYYIIPDRASNKIIITESILTSPPEVAHDLGDMPFTPPWRLWGKADSEGTPDTESLFRMAAAKILN